MASRDIEVPSTSRKVDEQVIQHNQPLNFVYGLFKNNVKDIFKVDLPLRNIEKLDDIESKFKEDSIVMFQFVSFLCTLVPRIPCNTMEGKINVILDMLFCTEFGSISVKSVFNAHKTSKSKKVFGKDFPNLCYTIETAVILALGCLKPTHNQVIKAIQSYFSPPK